MKIKQPIEVLKFRLSKLNEAYQNFVIEGKVDVLSYPQLIIEIWQNNLNTQYKY